MSLTSVNAMLEEVDIEYCGRSSLDRVLDAPQVMVKDAFVCSQGRKSLDSVGGVMSESTYTLKGWVRESWPQVHYHPQANLVRTVAIRGEA